MASFNLTTSKTALCSTRVTSARSSIPSVRLGGARSSRLVVRAETSVLDRVSKVVKEQLDFEKEIKPEYSFLDDLKADSLDTVEIVMALEEEFGFEVPEKEAEKITTVGDAVVMIETLLKEES